MLIVLFTSKGLHFINIICMTTPGLEHPLEESIWLWAWKCGERYEMSAKKLAAVYHFISIFPKYMQDLLAIAS